MKHALVLAFALALTGCKEKNPDGASGSASGSGPATGAGTAAPPPFAGKLTVDRVMGARELVKPFDPWDQGFALLQAQVGPPTKLEGARHTWAVVEGDACAHFYVTKDNGADYKMDGIIVGTVQAPQQSSKSGPPGAHAECLRAAGVDRGPPEDPNAPGPPTDGRAVPVAELRAAVIPGRSKWKGQNVKVAAVLAAVTTSTQGTDAYVTVNLTAGADDKSEPFHCAFEKNAKAPAFDLGTPVIASGTIMFQEWTSMGSGGKTLKASLTDCTVVAASK
jgi:hypothetical protein